MAYNHRTEFPRNVLHLADVTSTATHIATTPTAFSRIEISNQDVAARTIVFRAIAGTPPILRMRVPASSSITVPGWLVDSAGVEVLTVGSAAAGVHITVHYV